MGKTEDTVAPNSRIYLAWAVAVAIAALFSGEALAQGSGLAADEIIQRAVEKAKQEDADKTRYTFLQRVTKDELDDDGKVKETEKLVYRSVPIGDKSFSRLEKKDGQALTGDELKEVQEKEKEFIEEQKEPKKKDKNEYEFKIDGKFVAKYKFTLKKEETINGRAAYVLDYKPKSKDLPEDNIADRFMNKTKGTIWIDKEDFAISKVTTKLMEPIKVFGGIAASIKEMDMAYTRQRINGKWFPKAMRQTAAGRQLVSSFNTRATVKFDSFEKVE